MSGSDNAHSKYSASGSKRYINCPGSIELAKFAPPEENSEFAAEGTLAHDKAEEALIAHMCKRSARVEWEGKPELAQHVQTYVNYVLDTWRGLGKPSIYIEDKVNLDWLYKGADFETTASDALFGTNDVAMVIPFKEIHVMDLKFGAGEPVFAENNTQGLYYGLGLLGEDNPYHVDRLVIHIIQPRCFANPQKITRWVVPVAEVYAFRDKLLNAIRRAKTDTETFKRGSHCKFCRAMPLCPAALKEVAVIKEAQESKIWEMPIEQMNANQLGGYISKIKDAKSVADALTKFARACLQRGFKVDGWKLVQGNQRKTWTDDGEVIEKLSKYVSEEELFDTKLKTPSKLLGMAKGDKNLTELIKSLISISRNAPLLVKETDKRGALDFGTPQSVQDDFKDLIEKGEK